MSITVTAAVPSEVRDLALAERGKRRIEWAFQSMCVLQNIRKYCIRTQPFAGVRLAACMDVTAETANLMIALRDGGATPILCGANPLSMQEDVAASLVKDYGIPVFAAKTESGELEPARLDAVLSQGPQILMDHDGALFAALHTRHSERVESVVGGTEDTAKGAVRLRRMASEGQLRCPVIALHNARARQLLENRYGTGQSTMDAVVRCTNVLLAGLNVVVLGYGNRGRGVALRASGLGARVTVTEIDPIKALMASMDGYRVTSMAEAATTGDVFVTATGCKNVIGREHFEKFKNGAILCNSGYSDAEIDMETLAQIASSHRQARESAEEFALRDGRRVYVLGEGRALSVAGEECPASVMDMVCGSQALCAEYLLKNRKSLDSSVYAIPADLDHQVAKIKLESMGIKIDRLTVEQEQYLANRSGEDDFQQMTNNKQLRKNS